MSTGRSAPALPRRGAEYRRSAGIRVRRKSCGALEEALTEEAGKTKRLNRTRQKLVRVGVCQILADLALKPRRSMGFLKLVEFGLGDMSAEALILKYQATAGTFLSKDRSRP